MEIDKRIEDYFRQGLAQGITTHVVEVNTTSDNKIALRMQPIRVPTQNDLQQLPPQIKQWARAQAEADVKAFAQSTPNNGDNVFANMMRGINQNIPTFNQLQSLMTGDGKEWSRAANLVHNAKEAVEMPRLGRRQPRDVEQQSEPVESYKSPMAGME